MATKKIVDIIVRRGAVERFNALSRKTADLPVVVSWDRRKADRRSASASTPVERRGGDRRKAKPFTWEAADFVVVDAAKKAASTFDTDKQQRTEKRTRPSQSARSRKRTVAR